MNLEMDKQLTAIFSVLETMQSTLKCSICLDLLSYPVTTKCGHSFCGVCIDHILSGSRGSGSCPLCMSIMTRRSLNENNKIVSLVDAVRKIMSCVKEDVGYDDSHRKKKEQPLSTALIKLSASNKAVSGCVSPIRRGTRNREQVTSIAKVDTKMTLLPKKDEPKSLTVDAEAKNVTQKNNVGEISANNLFCNSRGIGKINLLYSKESNLQEACKISPDGKYLQEAADFPITVSDEMQVNSVKRKVEEWLDNEVHTETAIYYPDDAVRTSNESNEFEHPEKYGTMSDSYPCIPYLKENAGISSSQATTVIFTPGRSFVDLKSHDNTQNNFELEDKQNVSSAIVVACESFTGDLLEEKENSNKLDKQANGRAKLKRANKRILSEKNIASKNQKKSDILEKENSEAFIDQSLTINIPPVVGLPENLKDDAMHLKANVKSKYAACLQNNLCINEKRSNDFSEQHPNSKGHNIRFASEIKCKFLENSSKPSRLTVKKRTRQSPGWSHIENVKKDLRSKHTVLNIKGGEGKQISDSSRIDTLSVITDLSQESVIVIEDQSQDKPSFRKNLEAGRFKRFKNAFSFKGKFTEHAGSEDKSGTQFKRRTKDCFPRNRKKVTNTVVEPPSKTVTITDDLDNVTINKGKNSDILSKIIGNKKINDQTLEDESSVFKSGNGGLIYPGNIDIHHSIKSADDSCEENHCDNIRVNNDNYFSHDKQTLMNSTKVNSNARLTRSKYKEIDQVHKENLHMDHDDAKLLSHVAPKINERTCDENKGNLDMDNFIPTTNSEPIENTECTGNVEVSANGLREAFKFGDAKLLSHVASKKNERICDKNKEKFDMGNLKPIANSEPIENTECSGNIEVCKNGLSEAFNLVNEQIRLNNCRKSFNLSSEPSKQDNCVEGIVFLGRNQAEINSIERKVSEDATPDIYSTYKNEKKYSQVGSRGSVSFVKKGKCEKRVATLCQHSIPCDMFQALKKFSNLMMANYSINQQCCFNMDSSSDISTTKQISFRKTSNKIAMAKCNTLRTKNPYEHEKLSRHHQPTYQGNVDNLAVSDNISDYMVQKKVSQDILICQNVDYNCIPVQETKNCKTVIHDEVYLKDDNIPSHSNRKLNFSPLLSPTSPLQSSLEKVSYNDKHSKDMSHQHSQFSLSMLPDLVNTSQPDIDKTILPDDVNKQPSNDAINEPQSNQKEQTSDADLHAAVSECHSENLQLGNDKNFDVISTDSTVLSSSLSGLTNMKRFRRITTLDSSEDSSSDEDLANLKRTSKRVRRANVESPTPASRNFAIGLPNSEELRDFERYDENIWNYYRTDNNSDNKKKVSLLSKKCGPFKPYPSEEDITSPEKEYIDPHSSNKKKSEYEGDIAAHISDDDELIPGTEEVLKRDGDYAEFVSKKSNNDKFNGTINLISQVSPISTVTSSNLELPLSTRNLFKKCNKSLNLAEKIITGSLKATNTDYLTHKCAGRKEVIKDNSTDHNISIEKCDNMETNHEIGYFEASSNQSLIIPSQQKDKMEQGSRKASPEMDFTCKLSDFHKDSQESISCESPKIFLKELLCRDKDKFSRDSDQESEELFKSISASILEQDAKLKLVVTEDTVMPPRIQKRDCMTIICTGLSNAEIEKVNRFVKIVCQQGTEVSNIWTKDVTHIVAKTDADGVTDRTLKYLYGVAYGIWIVSFSWVVDSLNSSILMPEEEYEVLDCTGCPGPNRGRKRSSPIFKNCQFCLVPPFSNITEEQFIELITICGGEVVSDAYNFNELKNDLKLVAIDSDSVLDINILEDIKRCGKVLIAHDWIIECIGMCALVALSSYIFGEPSQREIKASGVNGALLSETQDIL